MTFCFSYRFLGKSEDKLTIYFGNVPWMFPESYQVLSKQYFFTTIKKGWVKNSKNTQKISETFRVKTSESTVCFRPFITVLSVHFEYTGFPFSAIYYYILYIILIIYNILLSCMKTECVISGTTGGLMDPNCCYKISWSLTPTYNKTCWTDV